MIVAAYRLLVHGPVVRGKGSSQHALSQSNDEVHNPEPTKDMVHLHSEQMATKNMSRISHAIYKNKF